MSGHKPLAVSEVTTSPLPEEQESATFYTQHCVMVAKIYFPQRQATLADVYWINRNNWGK